MSAGTPDDGKSAGGGDCAKNAYNCIATANPLPKNDTVWMEDMTWMDVRDAMKAGKTTVIIATGGIDFHALPADDEAAITALTSIRGIGRWSAEIYLLFAEGRPDVFPAGDLAVQIELGKILGLDKRPTEKATRSLAEPWRPHRGALAVFLWHHYSIDALA